MTWRRAGQHLSHALMNSQARWGRRKKPEARGWKLETFCKVAPTTTARRLFSPQAGATGLPAHSGASFAASVPRAPNVASRRVCLQARSAMTFEQLCGPAFPLARPFASRLPLITRGRLEWSGPFSCQKSIRMRQS